MRRAILLILAAAATGLLGYVVALQLGASGIRVEVVNRAGVQLDEVQLHYTGGSQRIGALAGGATVSKELVPTGESALEISWTERPAGAEPLQRRERLDVYLEPNSSGRYEIELHEGGVVTFRGESASRVEGAP